MDLQRPSPKADPLVHFLYNQLRIEGMTKRELSRRSGICIGTLNNWWSNRHGNNVKLFQIRCALEVFKFGLKPSVEHAKHK